MKFPCSNSVVGRFLSVVHFDEQLPQGGAKLPVAPSGFGRLAAGRTAECCDNQLQGGESGKNAKIFQFLSEIYVL